MMAKCISLSNYNLSSTNVLIIGAGILWHVLGPSCVSPPGQLCREQGVCVPCTFCHPSCHLLSPLLRPSLCKLSDQRVFSLFVLHTNSPQVPRASGLCLL